MTSLTGIRNEHIAGIRTSLRVFPTHLEYGFQLFHLCLRRKQRLADNELCKNATHTPAVHAWSVPCRPQQQLRRPIPQGNHAIRKIRRQVTQPPCETEVRQLHTTIRTRVRLSFKSTQEDNAGATGEANTVRCGTHACTC